MGLRRMSMGWITVVGGMLTTTRHQKRDRGKHQLFPHFEMTAFDVEF